MRILMNCLLVIFVFWNSIELGSADIPIEAEEINYEPEEKQGVIKDISILHPTFRNKVILFLYECEKQGIELKILETYRNPVRQDSLKRKGFSKLSGGQSKHQHYIAIDVVPVINGKLQWNNRKLWKKINQIAESQGLKTGYKWRFFDPGHIEFPINIEEINTVPLPDTILIPLNY